VRPLVADGGDGLQIWISWLVVYFTTLSQ